MAEVNAKVRELEINLMDLKASVDRRFAQIIEEVPSRLQREIKHMESRDNHLWKDNQAKIGQLIDAVTRMRA